MFYAWKVRFNGLEVSDAKKRKGLEDENARLKRRLADAMLGNACQTAWKRGPVAFSMQTSTSSA